ncbi:MAG: tRNA (guanosine(37)-N1)-methyltransferase TrmD [Chloroflexales bacterium]
MHFDILTLFPGMFAGPLSESILKRAQQAGHIGVSLHNIRDWASDRHHTADDAPYGGGAGMVMKAVPLAAAIRAVLGQEAGEQEAGGGRREAGKQEAGGREQETGNEPAFCLPPPASRLLPPASRPLPPASRLLPPPVILLSPDGEVFSQAIAAELAAEPRIILVCGHYEGLDERVREALITRELSIGDYVLTGGELAAMVVVDAVARLVPGVIDGESIAEESHSGGLLEYPHYTRPAIWEGREVPSVLTSGHHGEVAKWRRRERLRRTLARRPDLLDGAAAQGLLDPKDLAYLAELGWVPGK